MISDDGATNGTPAPSFVNMTVGLQLLEGRKTLNVKLGVVENQSKSTVNGALGNTLTLNVFNKN